jgi:hypothetical protein
MSSITMLTHMEGRLVYRNDLLGLDPRPSPMPESIHLDM